VLPAPSPEDLREHLVATRIAGSVMTQVGDVLRKAQYVADGDPKHCFGLSGLAGSVDKVLEQVTAQFGWTYRPGEPEDGPTWIDPDLVVAELDRAAERLALAGRERQRVLLASGHPTGTMALWQRIGLALEAAGCEVLRFGEGTTVPGFAPGYTGRVRYVLNVAVLSSSGDLYHTHSPSPMEQVLDRADGPIDLVLADHGWAGAAIERGYDTVSIADVNDPALPMAKHAGRTSIVIGMDDNVWPADYDPVVAYLVAGLR